MTYSSASDAALYCPEIIGSGAEFDDETKPERTQVERYLTKGYGYINSRLAQAGYNTPVTSTATAYDALTDIEALYVASQVQLARMSSRIGPEERTKSQVLWDRFNFMLDGLLKQDLTRAGLTRRSGATLYAGGISHSDKDSYEDDSDRVEPRFKREQFRRGGVDLPAGEVTDEESD